MKDEELDNLIGTKLEVFLNPDEVHSEMKEITVKSWKRVGDTFMILSTDNEMYGDDEINWHYQITPEAALWVSLIEAGVLEEDYDTFDFDKYHQAFTTFMDKLVMIGMVTDTHKSDENADDIFSQEDIENLCQQDIDKMFNDDEINTRLTDNTSVGNSID